MWQIRWVSITYYWKPACVTDQQLVGFAEITGMEWKPYKGIFQHFGTTVIPSTQIDERVPSGFTLPFLTFAARVEAVSRPCLGCQVRRWLNCLYATVKKYTITQLLRGTVSGQCLAWAVRREQNSLGLQQRFFSGGLEKFHGYLEQVGLCRGQIRWKPKMRSWIQDQHPNWLKVAGSLDIGDVMEWLEEEALWHVQYIHYMRIRISIHTLYTLRRIQFTVQDQ